MSRTLLENLIDDGTLIAEVGTSIGRLKDPTLISALSEARSAHATKHDDPAATITLHRAITSALADIAPITLPDLRSGWRPYSPNRTTNITTLLFGLFCIGLVALTCYTNILYHKANYLHATAVELQNDRDRITIDMNRLLWMVKKNHSNVFNQVDERDNLLREEFVESLVRLQSADAKSSYYFTEASPRLNELNLGTRIASAFSAPFAIFDKPAVASGSSLSYENYMRQQRPPTTKPESVAGLAIQHTAGPNSGNIGGTLPPSFVADTKQYLRELGQLSAELYLVTYDPFAPKDFTLYINTFRESANLLAAWVLPALYGALGACAFLMRRLLDPALPGLPWYRLPFRVVLGGFAGVMLIWLFGPGLPEPGGQVLGSLGTFGIAFLVGYSTDVLFTALDRLVATASHAVGKFV